MRLLLAALVAGAGWVALMGRGTRSGRQPGDDRDQRHSPADGSNGIAADRQPERPAVLEGPDQRSRAEEAQRASDERHKRGERWYWTVTGVAAILATGATAAAALFAYWAYQASWEAVGETRRQADIAQAALVASTRARLKITSIKDVRVGPLSAGGVSVPLLRVVAAYKNFGQSPAQNIFLSLRVFVADTGPSPRETCENMKAEPGDASFEIVFPQDEEGDKIYGVGVSPGELEAQAAEARDARPGLPASLALVGCLTYRSTNSDAVYVTGIHGELGLAVAEPAHERGRRSAYEAIIEGGESASVGLVLHPLSAWAD